MAASREDAILYSGLNAVPPKKIDRKQEIPKNMIMNIMQPIVHAIYIQANRNQAEHQIA